MDGLALALSEVPETLIEQRGLERLIHGRGGERELRFLRRARPPLLPVWHDGQLEIVPWGRRGGGLTWQATVDAGAWRGAELVEIRASAGCERGIWYPIRQGVRGLVANGAAYLIVEPATHYYRTMTRSDRMPVLIGERI